MSTLWHFGSELSTSSYGKSLSNLLGLDYKKFMVDDPTNYQIFSHILRQTSLFESNDVILVNWVDFRKNDIVKQKNNKAIIKSFHSELDSDFNDDYISYKHYYQKQYHKESFLLFNLVITYFESLFNMNNVNIYFLYDTKRNFLIPPTFDLCYQLTHNNNKSSFLEFLIDGRHIDFEKNRICSTSIEYISHYIQNLMRTYNHVYSKSFDNSMFPKEKLTIDKYTTTDHSTQVDNSPTKII